MQHFDDSINKYKDGVLYLPILLIEQLVAYLPSGKYMKMFKSIHTPYFRWLVWVLLTYLYAEFVVSSLKVGVLFTIKDDGPFTVIWEVV